MLTIIFHGFFHCGTNRNQFSKKYGKKLKKRDAVSSEQRVELWTFDLGNRRANPLRYTEPSRRFLSLYQLSQVHKTLRSHFYLSRNSTADTRTYADRHNFNISTSSTSKKRGWVGGLVGGGVTVLSCCTSGESTTLCGFASSSFASVPGARRSSKWLAAMTHVDRCHSTSLNPFTACSSLSELCWLPSRSGAGNVRGAAHKNVGLQLDA